MTNASDKGMDLKVLSCVVILGHVWGSFEVAHTKSLRLNGRYRQRSKESHIGIPKIVHHIFLDGEAAYWRNATLGDEFTPNFYPRKKDQGDKNATFRHEWKTGCQRLMPDWRVQTLSESACSPELFSYSPS